MNRIHLFTSIALVSFVSLLPAQDQVSTESPKAKEEGQSYQDIVSEIANKDDRDARDYAIFAASTWELGRRAKQSGEAIPDSSIHDAIDAVEEGRQLDAAETDWDKLREELEALLVKPEQQSQQQQDAQNQQQQQNQDGQSQEGQQGQGEQQQSQDQNGNQQQQPNSDKQQQSSQNADQQSDQEQQAGEKSQEAQSDPQQGSDGDASEQRQDGAQMGDLSEQIDPQNLNFADGGEASADMDQPQNEMQTLGGQQGEKQKVDADKAAVMQMLDQLRQQDDPGKLFMILQEAQSGEKKQQQPNAKDW
ncbi:hypothetical protein [Pelagicoccus sp. SDUM812003]|uniref:hypothetical protein n=1 Tax=Pelagicoccus sp. SDUM812003 TaxID=3041267 RepID=UPI00280EFBAC|nr:hypothetical protein [Pelagicoccus sp. SDUM812003]MDQ8203080.1 hypothetical protein [Pelagicoccus sp. SDUM812003]